ncbi:recombinase family protein [Mesorhizobium caraganae]|uniref:recombinase family protein n=1 Tax=Mesorhizobium caraganae TaxID=483206 RepID=UPI00193AB618|nr:recombinase family protein [Mesorhizobium caraganae]MBM2716209.1 recombinase family protein [Mesorhizobium caraganae]
MKYGYARVSTEAQDLASQVERLQAAGCERIFFEKRSGKDANRRQLQRLLKVLRPGDLVHAVVSDRIARDPVDMLDILSTVTAAGASLRLLDEPFIDTTSEMSDLMLFLLGWAAKWQRRRILENTANGRARAKAKGVKFGRKPKLSLQQRAEALARLAAGEAQREVADSLMVSGSTISRLQSQATHLAR